MPKAVEDRLKREASKKGLTGRRRDAYVYGTMNKLGMLHQGGSSHRSNHGAGHGTTQPLT